MKEEQEGPWCDEEACCESCDYVWIAVHPCCEELECPKCGQMTRSTHSINNEAWFGRQM